MSRSFTAAILIVAVSAAVLQAGQRRPPAKKPEPPPSIAPLVLPDLLDLYAAGRVDEALGQISRQDDKIARNLRAHWALEARSWIDADPAVRLHRLFVAAAFALETEQLRAERGDWGMAVGDPPCAGPCVLDWAQALLVERGAPDRAEKAWDLAAISLASGVRDWRYLQRIIDSGAPPSPAPTALVPGFIERTLLRFPGDPQLKLEQAVAAAERFSVTVDGGRMATDGANLMVRMGPPASFGMPGTARPTVVRALPTAAADMLDALVADPIVGPEAQMRSGYLHWSMNQDETATRSLRQAAERTSDPDARYLSRFLLGWIAQQAGRPAEAAPEYEAALLARPDSQSAAIALGTIRLQQGDAAAADQIARASIDRRRTDDDPWRLFLYGHHPLLSVRLAAVRAEVRR
jgi:tetratricopeptide (TPR) repeat protein